LRKCAAHKRAAHKKYQKDFSHQLLFDTADIGAIRSVELSLACRIAPSEGFNDTKIAGNTGCMSLTAPTNTLQLAIIAIDMTGPWEPELFS
jgi:hypothetical protein